MNRSSYKVVIIGAGPAGSAAALRIAAHRPDLAAQTLVLDRSVFPRDKLCAGGLSPLAESQLARVQAATTVPSSPVRAVEFGFASHRKLVRAASGLAFRTVLRREFDASLLDLVRRRGVAVEEGEHVRAIEVGRTAISIVTDRREHHAQVTIGADGATSLARRAIGVGSGARGFALEALVSADRRLAAAFSEGTATVDFAPIKAGLGGYCWIFPSGKGDGETTLLNCGIAVFAPDRVRCGQDARSFLVDWLASRGLPCDSSSIRGHGLIAYHPETRLGGPRVCVAGDAAGIDPYLGEGIPCALGTGIAAADAVIAASDRNDFDLTRHHERVRRSPIGQIMEQRRLRAHARYGRDPVERYFLAARFFAQAKLEQTGSRPIAGRTPPLDTIDAIG